MAIDALHCKECRAEYDLDARYVCERCFGPLEVSYSHAPVEDVGRRPPPDPGRAPEHLALRRLPAARGAARAVAARDSRGLPAGCTPLVRADRLAERLGLGEVWVKNDAANPTHSFKDRVVAVALARARELGFETLACASTGNLANAVAAHAAAAGLDSYVFIPADLEEQKVLATGVYGTRRGRRPRQLRRRQPAVHGALGRAPVGLRQRQHAPVLRRGLQDARLRDRRAARAGRRPTASSPRSPRARCSPRSPAASRSGSSSG